MKEITKIISKKVISFLDGEEIGFVLDVLFDENVEVLKGYLIEDYESQNVMFLALENIRAESDEYVFVDNALSLEYDDFLPNNPIGKIVLNDEGLNFGRIEEVILEKNKLIKLITNKSEIFSKLINLSGKNYVFFKKNIKNLKNNKKEIKNIKNLPKIKALNNDVEKQIPYKASVNKQNIIGKCCSVTILGYNNEIIARKNEKITKKIIENAKKHNKLNFLLFNCF